MGDDCDFSERPENICCVRNFSDGMCAVDNTKHESNCDQREFFDCMSESVEYMDAQAQECMQVDQREHKIDPSIARAQALIEKSRNS